MVRNVPFDVLVTWPTPNYVDPEFRGNINLIVNVVLLSIVMPTVALRIYTRHYMRHWLGWDDLFCVLGLITTIAFCVTVIINCYLYKAGAHVWDIPLLTFSSGLKTAMACKALFTVSGTLIRQSLLFFYLRLLGDAGIRWFHWVIHGTTCFNLAAGICFTIMSIVECIPVSAYWHYPSNAYGKCIDEGIKTLAAGIILVVLDFWVVLLPIPIIVRLQMSWKAKIGVICLLSMGLAASAAAAVRCYYIWKSLIQSYDVSWWVAPLYVAAAIELNVALFCSCAPAIRPWVRTHMPWITKPISWLGRLRSYSRSKYQKEDLSSNYASDGKPATDPEARAPSTQAMHGVEMKKMHDTNAKYGGNFLLEATRASSQDGLFDVSSTVYSQSRHNGTLTYGSEEELRVPSAQSIDKEEVITAISRAIRGIGIGDEPIPESFSISRGNSRVNSRANSFAHSRTGSFSQRPGTQDKEPMPAVPHLPSGASRTKSRKSSFETAAHSKFAVENAASRASARSSHEDQARGKKSSETRINPSVEGHRSTYVSPAASSTTLKPQSSKEYKPLSRESSTTRDPYGYGNLQTHAGIGSIRSANRDTSPANISVDRKSEQVSEREAANEGWAQWRRASRKLDTQKSGDIDADKTPLHHPDSDVSTREAIIAATHYGHGDVTAEPDSQRKAKRAKKGSPVQPQASAPIVPRHPRYTTPLNLDSTVSAQHVNFSQPRPSSARASELPSTQHQARPYTQDSGTRPNNEWAGHRRQQESVASDSHTFFLDESRETSEAGNLE